jgi:hypothetical protein
MNNKTLNGNVPHKNSTVFLKGTRQTKWLHEHKFVSLPITFHFSTSCTRFLATNATGLYPSRIKNIAFKIQAISPCISLKKNGWFVLLSLIWNYLG